MKILLTSFVRSNGYDRGAFTYDAAGRLLTASSDNSTVTRTWDAAGRLLTEKQSFNGTTFTPPLLKYTYRQDSKVTRLYVGPGETYDFLLGYDGRARLSTLRYNPNTSTDHQYVYDLASNVTNRLNYLNGTSVAYAVDALDRVNQRDIYLPGEIFSRETYTFDPMNRMTDIRREETLTNDHFGYDQMGEMTLAQYGTAVTPTPTPSPTPTPTATPSGTPTPTPTQVAPVYIYDNGYQQGEPMPVYMETETEGATIFYTSHLTTQGCPPDPTHDENGNPTGETLVYDPASLPTVNVGTAVYFSALGYKEGLADSEVTACFREDSVQERPLDGPLRTVSYTWDKAGNRSVVTDTAGVTQNYITNELNQYKNINGVPMSNGPAHQIASFDGVSYDYIGDMYPARATAGANTYTLYYDALGRVVRRERFDVNTFTTTTNYYLFDGAHWVLEYNPDGTVQSNVLYGLGVDEILGRFNGGAPVGSQLQWPYPDRNNNTSVVTGEGGVVLEYYRYDAFGQPTVYDGNDNLLTGTAIANRFLFTGREWNPEYKFYEYRARAYSPSLGRFMSEDPKDFEGGDYNLYRYCLNDPMDLSDPMGLDFIQSSGTPADWAKFNQGLAYISENREAAAIISRLRKFDIPVHLNHKFINGSTSDNGLAFDPTRGQIIPGKGLQSPALILAHELRHVLDQLVHPAEFKANRDAGNRRYGSHEPNGLNKNEESALRTEKAVAITKGEPYRTAGEYVRGTTPQEVPTVTTHTEYRTPIDSHIPIPVEVPNKSN